LKHSVEAETHCIARLLISDSFLADSVCR